MRGEAPGNLLRVPVESARLHFAVGICRKIAALVEIMMEARWRKSPCGRVFIFARRAKSSIAMC